LSIISDYKEAIPYMMEILNYKRNTNKELLSDMNIELNRALIVLNDKHLKIRIL